MTDEYRKALESLRACTLKEIQRLILTDLRTIQREKADEAERTDWEGEE